MKLMKLQRVSAIFGGAIRRMKRWFGVQSYLRTEDRRVLEQVIFPYFLQSQDYKRVLFIGCSWATQAYNQLFKTKDYITLDPDPETGKYGSPRHYVGYMTDIRTLFSPGSVDVIFCNGVVGWGLNDLSEANLSFQACADALRPGGVLVVGWNDIPGRRPFALDEVSSLKQLVPLHFSPLEGSRYLTPGEWRHTYEFFTKVAPCDSFGQ